MLRVVRQRYASQLLPGRRYSTATFPTSFSYDQQETNGPVSIPLLQLKMALSSSYSSPDHVWTMYTDALNSPETNEIDLETHRHVLRLCTLKDMRTGSKHRYLNKSRPAPAHIHEERFQNVIQNILAFGQPSIEDYHFVLEQFAAVGHSIGSMRVYKEMKNIRLCQPDNVTIALVLQSIAHRLVIPERKADRSETIHHAAGQLRQLLDDMQKLKLPWTGTNMDLTLRIMKHTSDEENFDRILKLGYGIDMRYPGSPLLDSESSALLPFTTSTLNTVLFMYGMSGNTSKLVQAFEVLSVPPPPPTRLAQLYKEGLIRSEIPKTPTAQANTTSYAFLLRHICAMDQDHLARHYLIQAIEYAWEVSWALRRKTVVTPNISDVHAPTMTVNRAMFLSVFGLSNRNKDVQLMRWVLGRIPWVVKQKQGDLLHYSGLVKHLKKRGQWPQDIPVSTFLTRMASAAKSDYVEIDDVRWRTADIDDVLAVDPRRQEPPSPRPPKPLDVELHMRILRDDIAGLTALEEYIRPILARTIERVKDRLGRRVWQGKDIYLRTEAGRVQVSKEKWIEIANYRPKLSGAFVRPRSHFFHVRIRQEFEKHMRALRREKRQQALGTSGSFF